MRSGNVAITSALALFAVAFGTLRLAADESSVTFYGGAGRVGGSCALVENGGKRVLVDCGTNYSDERDKAGDDENESFGFDPRSVSELYLTHAHRDHAGRIPQLVRAGFCGTVWMTEATLRILSVLWKSQVKYENAAHRWKWSVGRKRKTPTVHWRRECPWAGKIKEKNVGTFTGTYLSPSSRELTKEYINHPEWFDSDCVAGVRDLFKATKRKFDAEKFRGGSGILLTTSGMMDVGYSYRFLSDLVPREDVTVCLAGFQAKGTPGRKLKDGEIAESRKRYVMRKVE